MEKQSEVRRKKLVRKILVKSMLFVYNDRQRKANMGGYGGIGRRAVIKSKNIEFSAFFVVLKTEVCQFVCHHRIFNRHNLKMKGVTEMEEFNRNKERIELLPERKDELFCIICEEYCKHYAAADEKDGEELFAQHCAGCRIKQYL